MWLVEGTFPYWRNEDRKAQFYFNCNQTMNPYTWAAPIHWKGYINGTEVSFVQTSAHGSDRSDYDFSSLPEQYVEAIPYIVEAIDDKMRTMD